MTQESAVPRPVNTVLAELQAHNRAIAAHHKEVHKVSDALKEGLERLEGLKTHKRNLEIELLDALENPPPTPGPVEVEWSPSAELIAWATRITGAVHVEATVDEMAGQMIVRAELIHDTITVSPCMHGEDTGGRVATFITAVLEAAAFARKLRVDRVDDYSAELPKPYLVGGVAA